MTLELLIAPKNYSSWSVRPWLVMHHFDIPFTERTVALFFDPDAKETILSWSGAGTVPVLRDGALTIWGSLAVMEYLAEQYPNKPLWPVDAHERALARAVSGEMHSSFAAMRGEIPMNVRAQIGGIPLSGEAQADIARICDIWRECRAACPHGPFLFGPFTIADAMYAPVISRFKTYGMALDETCGAYADAVLTLPSVKAWYAAAADETWRVEKYEFGG